MFSNVLGWFDNAGNSYMDGKMCLLNKFGQTIMVSYVYDADV